MSGYNLYLRHLLSMRTELTRCQSALNETEVPLIEPVQQFQENIDRPSRGGGSCVLHNANKLLAESDAFLFPLVLQECYDFISQFKISNFDADLEVI